MAASDRRHEDDAAFLLEFDEAVAAGGIGGTGVALATDGRSGSRRKTHPAIRPSVVLMNPVSRVSKLVP